MCIAFLGFFSGLFPIQVSSPVGGSQIDLRGPNIGYNHQGYFLLCTEDNQRKGPGKKANGLSALTHV